MIAILMYHNVGEKGRHLNVSPQGLAKQCQMLQRLRFRVMPLRELAEHLHHRQLPRRAAVFTFDDALLGVYEHAAPILRRHGWVGTVFAVSRRLGGETDWTDDYRHRVMSREQLLALHRAGWEVGGHTLTHSYLTRLPPEDARHEIEQCRHELEELTGAPVLSFCYPYGDWNDAVTQMVREAGYQAACTVRKGLVKPQDNPLTLPRVHIAYSDGATGLLYRLWRAWRRTR
ncbi:MAG: polysaccharide deacetylase family protein [Firmicutes bacterium]|nr:polysaccharide deacetylase family protein [Bacillota bacterium]